MLRRTARVLSGLLPLALVALGLVVVPAPAQAASDCQGFSYGRVKGPRLGYGAEDLRDYPVKALTCRAYFLPSMNAGFVPQGLAVDGGTVWVSGYTYTQKVEDQACRLVRIEIATGKVLANVGRLTGAAGSSRPTFCRHGGGLSLYGGKLWISERERLWLVDPKKIGTRSNPVVRMWRIHEPVFGSSVNVTSGRVGLLQFSRGTYGVLAWLTVDDVMRAGVTDIGASRTKTQAAPTASRHTVPFAQGSTPWAGHGLLMTRSWNGCGQLVMPDRTLIGALPGIQDVQLVSGNRMWLISESSAQPYTNATRAVVPMLNEVDATATLDLDGHGSCP